MNGETEAELAQHSWCPAANLDKSPARLPVAQDWVNTWRAGEKNGWGDLKTNNGWLHMEAVNQKKKFHILKYQ